MGNLIVREVSKKDEIAFLSIRNHPDNYKWFFNSSTISLEEHRDWFHERILNMQFFTLVAEIDNEVVGMAYISDTTHFSPKISIGIMPSLRNSGVGTKLLSELILRARIRGFKSLTAEILNTNSISIRFFLKSGFNPESEDKSFHKNRKQEVIYLSMNLTI
jgi:L-amino acid N-acyltransferase YncA